MGKILSQKDISKLKTVKNIVLVGGCFDILHKGHIYFLHEVKKKGNVVVLLESDESVRKMKGKNRPINNQKDRSLILSCLEMVDYVINLNGVLKHSDYDRIIKAINPTFIGTVEGDRKIEHKERQMEKFGPKLLTVKRVNNISTTKLLEIVRTKYES
ncbi:MAG TPA: adenylyltransferase/cytidyltransferase family protein [Patescibacteria group bacterium]|nr:adenylyltransferase/cytidyltransferase family protein [Patescibacteria group bacterium]